MTTKKKVRRRQPARARATLPPDPPRDAHGLDRLMLDGRSARLSFGDRLVGAKRSPSIDGPSRIVLEVWDGDGAILSAGILGRKVMSRVLTVRLDGLTYVVASVSRSGGVLTMSCENVNVNRLRQHGRDRPLRVRRSGSFTRAHFVAEMFRDAGIEPLVLDENVPQATLGAAVKAQASADKPPRTRGTQLAGTLTVKGTKATPEQRRVMAEVMAAAQSVKGATPRAVLALVEAIITECEFRNVQGDGADAVSFGVIQNIPGTSNGLKGTFTKAQALDIDYSVRSALLPPGPTSKGGLIKLARDNPGWSPGQVAARAINGGGDSQYAQKCDGHKAEAEKIILAAGGDITFGGASSSSSSSSSAGYFERKKGESSWAAARRLLDEVQWRLFEREGTVVIATDAALMRAAPSLDIDAAGSFVDEGGIAFEMLRGTSASTASGRLLASAYQVDAGEVARVVGQSQVADRWLIQSATVDLREQDPWVDFELTQPREALPEPAAETGDGDSDTEAGTEPAGDTDKAARVRAAARYFSSVQPGYNTNGHGQLCRNMNPRKGGDCSSSTSWVLWKAGFLAGDAAVRVSDQFLNWGSAGEGRHFTVWVKEGSGNDGHVFIQGKDENGWWRIDTGEGGGARWHTTPAGYLAGRYRPRHSQGY